MWVTLWEPFLATETLAESRTNVTSEFRSILKQQYAEAEREIEIEREEERDRQRELERE